jgi:hypothetical protein
MMAGLSMPPEVDDTAIAAPVRAIWYLTNHS